MPTLEQHFSYLEAAIAEAWASPLSVRKARLAVALIDAYVDRLYAADTIRAEDVLAFRAQQSAANPLLALLLAIAQANPGAPEMLIQTSPVYVADYPHLSEAEFMVTLYNDSTVPRLLIRRGDANFDAHAVLRDALEALRALMPPVRAN